MRACVVAGVPAPVAAAGRYVNKCQPSGKVYFTNLPSDFNTAHSTVPTSTPSQIISGRIVTGNDGVPFRDPACLSFGHLGLREPQLPELATFPAHGPGAGGGKPAPK